MNIPEFIKEQGFPEGEYIVVASGILNALGIRDSEDIDLVITLKLYSLLKDTGWAEVNKGTYSVLEHGPFEAGLCWDSDENETPNLDDLLDSATYIDGVPFAGLSRVLEWKRTMQRPKDIIDIGLIEEYLQKSEI